MDNLFKVLGVGNPSFDHIFLEERGNNVYKYSRGGHTVSNVLANLSNLGIANAQIGFCGTQNPYGEASLFDLEQIGTNIGFILRAPNKNTQIIFQKTWLDKNNNPRHEFTSKCLVCGSTPKNLAPQLNYIKSSEYHQLKDKDFKVVVVDKLNQGTAAFVHDITKHNSDILSIIDIGRISGLRFQSIDSIMNMLMDFDISFLNETVYRFLGNLLGHDPLQSLIDSKGNSRQPRIIIVTKGNSGLECNHYDGDGFVKSHIQPMDTDVVCTSGAGDALLSNFIYEYILHNITKDRLLRDDKLVLENLKKSTNSLGSVLGNLGARGHLPRYDLGLSISKYEGVNIDEIRDNVLYERVCPFCWTEFPKSTDSQKQITPKQNFDHVINLLSYRGLSAIFSLDIVEKCRKILSSGETYAITGTGGSRSPSMYIAQLISAGNHNHSTFYYPYDYYRGLGTKTDWLIVLSYSGNTNDCRLAIHKAREMGVRRIALVTNQQKPKLANLLHGTNTADGDIIVSYGNKNLGREKGFLSFAGVITPSILFALGSNLDINESDIQQMFDWANSIDDNDLHRLAESVSNTRQVEIIGGAYSFPALYDLESKLIEGGISSVQTHECKDFSHGRFMFSLKGTGLKIPKILLHVGDDQYENLLAKQIIGKIKKAPVLHIKTSYKGLKGGLEMLIRVQYLIYKLSRILYGENKDITKPSSIPTEGLKLYNWKPLLK